MSARPRISRRLRRLLPFLLVGSLVPKGPLWAIEWLGGDPTATDFNTGAHWDGGAVPDGTQTADFLGASPHEISLAASASVLGLRFEAPSVGYTLSVNDTSMLTIGAEGIRSTSNEVQNILITGGGGIDMYEGQVSGDIRITAQGDYGMSSFRSGIVTGNLNVINERESYFIFGYHPDGVSIFDAGTTVFENRGAGTLVFSLGFRGDRATFINSSNGSLIFAYDPTVSSATIVNNGTMTLNVDAGVFEVGSLAGSGTVQLDGFAPTNLVVGGNGLSTEYSGSISGAGSMLIKIGDGTLTLSGENNTYNGGTQVLGGTLIGNSTSVPGNITNNATFVFNQEVDGTYAGLLNGGGALVKEGAGTLSLSADNWVYTGTTTINTGTLSLDNNLGGQVEVGPQGVLTGLGAADRVINRGTVRVAPATADELTFYDYSGPGTLEIAFDGIENPILDVIRTADLTDGTLHLSGSNFVLGSYEVLRAPTIIGEFAVTGGSAFLEYDTIYNANNVVVDLKAYNYSVPAVTPNQEAVVEVLEEVAPELDETPVPGDRFAAAIAKLSSLTSRAAAQAAISQLGGDSLAVFQDVALRHARLFTQQLVEREVPMDSASTALLPSRIQLAQAGEPAPGVAAPVPPTGRKKGLWGRMIGDFAQIDGDSDTGSPASNMSTGGFQTGYDLALGEAALAGLTVGYARTGVSVDDRDSSGDSNALSFGVYGRYAPGAFFTNSALSYLRDSNEMDRTVPGGTAASDFDSSVLTLYGDVGYAFEPLPDTAVEPLVSLRLSRLSQGDFTETGAATGLRVEEEKLTSAVMAFGARVAHLFGAESKHPFLLGGSLGMEYEMGDTVREVSSQFADAPGTALLVQGTPQERLAGEVAFNARLAITESVQTYANLGFSIASAHTAQTIMGGVRWTW